MTEHGTMDFDFRRRCYTDEGTHQVLRYGLDAADVAHWLGLPRARDVRTCYADLSVGPRVRRAGHPIEEEYRHAKYFFTKSLRKEQEKAGGHVAVVQGGGDEDSIRARYGVGGARRAPEAEAGAGRDGGGDQDGEGEVA